MTIQFDSRKTVNQELIKKRIMIYDEVAPKLNELLCFFLIRGEWKALTPSLMVQRKRELDRIIHIQGHLFSDDLFNQYNAFIHLCFKTFTGVGRDARLRADRTRLAKHWGAEWKSEWDSQFVEPELAINRREVAKEYEKLLLRLGIDIGVKRHTRWKRVKSRVRFRHLKSMRVD